MVDAALVSGWMSGMKVTCSYVVAGLVHSSDEELQTNDGVDDDDKENQQSDVEQRDHRLHDGVQHDLETWRTNKRTEVEQPIRHSGALSSLSGPELTGNSRNQPEGPQDPEGPQSFDIQASRFTWNMMGGRLLARLVSHRLQDDTEQAAQTITHEEEQVEERESV